MEEEIDKSIRRQIVVEVARQIFIDWAANLSNMAMRESNFAPADQAFELAEIWADAQIKYCEEEENK